MLSMQGRTPQGVRGLKPAAGKRNQEQERRTPQGVRGLKPEIDGAVMEGSRSHSARSAWIETNVVNYFI